MRSRLPSRGEEIANAVSHGVACLAAVVAVPVLVLAALERGDAAAVVGVSIFGGAMVMLYFVSALYHAVPYNRPAKHILRVLDHAAIYLLIAGTYTPFTLGVLRGPWGWTLFGLVWGLALLGIALKVAAGVHSPRRAAWLYLGMGWLVLIALNPLLASVPGWGLFWLFAGGAAYTVGVVFFLFERMRYAHLVWHLFVMAGTACHFIAVLRYAA